jgi:hypothetical protein
MGIRSTPARLARRGPPDRHLSTDPQKPCNFRLTLGPISYIMLTTKCDLFRSLFVSCVKAKTPESGWLFPPSAYCPHDCDDCNNPCKLSRYHVGPHRCGARHYGRRIMRSAALSTRFVCQIFASCWKTDLQGAKNETNTLPTHTRGSGTRGGNPQSSTKTVVLRWCACAFSFPEGNGGQV